MPTKVVVGAQWGDEGKGKIIDILASQSDVVVRSQGGNNAGHTIKQKDKTYALKLIPSGILFPNVCCYIGAGVVLNPEAILLEIEKLKEENIDFKNLKIDPRVQIIMPWHIALDAAQEEKKGKNNIGTTKKGIGPCYCDKVKRIGIRLHELINPKIFRERAKIVGEFNNEILVKIYNKAPLKIDEIIEKYLSYGEQLKQYVADISSLVYDAYCANKKILFEGAQGAMLDVNFGTYPFVTSSSPITGGVCTGVGIGPTYIDDIIGVCKAYTTRVGMGPFPSEILDEKATLIREKGFEFGTNTKRERRIGWFDAVVLNHSKIVNGFKKIALNKLDILSGIEKLKICTAYQTKDKKIIKNFPPCLETLDEITPIYEEMPGFSEDITNCKTIEELPTNCKKYILKIEELCGCKVEMIGVGPKRHQNIYRNI